MLLLDFRIAEKVASIVDLIHKGAIELVIDKYRSICKVYLGYRWLGGLTGRQINYVLIQKHGRAHGDI